MSRTRTIEFLLILAWPLVACASKQYILPIADEGPKPSPPTVQGRIASVEPGQIVVVPDELGTVGSSKTVVRISSETEIFTAMGGYVQPSELLAGIRVRVWCARPTTPKAGQVLTAAMVMIASKDPNDEWP
jgi:hypothetical protein